jgi:putative hydrolase
MNEEPKDEPAEPAGGSPFEQLFAALGGTGGQPGGGMPDLGVLLGQLQRMFTAHEGSVNWDLARDTARSALAQHKDPSPSTADKRAVADAVRLAEVWLDDACTLPAGSTTAEAWSRAEWVEATMPVWQQLVEPVAGSVVAAMQQAIPEEAKAMAGPFVGLLGQAGGAMFGAQIGQAIGGLAAEVVSVCEIGLPLGPAGRAALVTHNVREFGAGLGVEHSDVVLYLALRECAYQRLFGHVPWLRSHLLGLVEEYARGISIDIEAIEATISGIDPANLQGVQEALAGGLFEPQETAAQSAALGRLETALALVEGWTDDVVGEATGQRMPAAAALREAVRRRRAAGGPAEQTFASLVGLELRPRRLRDAAALWGALRTAAGERARDAVWTHPDLMPGPADLDDPLGFAERAKSGAVDTDSAEFDAALTALLSDDVAADDAAPNDNPAAGDDPAAQGESAGDDPAAQDDDGSSPAR